MLSLPQGDACTTTVVKITKHAPNTHTQKTQRSGATINSESTTREPQQAKFQINSTCHIFALDSTVVKSQRNILARVEAFLVTEK